MTDWKDIPAGVREAVLLELRWRSLGLRLEASDAGYAAREVEEHRQAEIAQRAAEVAADRNALAGAYEALGELARMAAE